MIEEGSIEETGIDFEAFFQECFNPSSPDVSSVKELPSSPSSGQSSPWTKWSAQLASRSTWPLLHLTGPGISLSVGSAQRSSAAQQLHLDLRASSASTSLSSPSPSS